MMKQIIFALLLALTCCTWAHGKNRTVTENDSLGNKKRVIELRDTTINGKATTDTLSIMTYGNKAAASADDNNEEHRSYSNNPWNVDFDTASETLVSVTAIIFVFGFPIIVIFIVFFFRYKNRKAKYRLAEQALASGQSLPDNFFKNAEAESLYSKAIKNIFTGIGLFIFLWAITGKFGVACVGILIMFMGFGQLVIHFGQQKKNEDK